MTRITDKTVKSKYPPKQTNVTWIDTSVKPAVTKGFIDGQWVVVSGGGGTKKYSDLEEKPLINGVELDGNKTSQDLGVYSKPSGGIPQSDLTQDVQTSLNKADTAYQKPLSGIPESDLSSDVQQALQKHFKGWYDSSSNLPDNPVVGDYAYVKGAESTDPAAIYECTTAGSWSDSGRTADTSNVQTFESGQEVNETYIDDTHLVNPKSGALPTAEDVMQLKAKLEGVTASETKASSYPVADGFIACRNSGSSKVTGHYYTDTSRKTAFVALDGLKSVRFLGLKTKSDAYIVGYVYLNIDNISTFLSGLSNSDDLATYIIGNVHPFDVDEAQANNTELIEILSSNPEGANYIALFYDTNQSSGYAVKDTNFYCYLQSGETVKEHIESLESKGVTFEDIPISLLGIGNGYISSSNNKWVHVSQSGHYELSVQRGETFLIGKSGGYTCRYAFLTKSNLSPISLSAASYITGTSLESFSNGEVLVTVPQDCVLYVMRGEDNAVTARPNYIKKVIGYDVIKGDDVATDFITCEKGKVFSAERGSALKAIIGDSNLIREVRIIEYDEVSGYANSDSVGSDSTGQYKYAVFDVSGYNRVRFLGLVRKGSQGSIGWHFMDENENIIANSGGKYDYNPSTDRGYLKEYVVDIPNGAKYFVTNVYVYADAYAKLDDSNFYIYKQLGKTLSDKIADNTDALSLRNTLEPSSVINGEAIVWQNGEAVFNPNYGSNYNLYQYLIGSELSEATLELDAKLNRSISSIYFVYYYNMTTDSGDEGTVQTYNYLGKSEEHGSSSTAKSVHITLNLPETTNCIFVNSNRGGAPMIMVSGVERYNIQQIDSKVDSVNRNNGLPDYYSTLLQNLEYNVCKIFNEHISDAFLEDSTEIHDGVDGFCFFTDPHYPRNNMMSGRIIREILNATPINKAICGGDIEDNSYWLYKPYSKHLLNMGQIKETGKDVFSVRGNHDYSVSWASGGVQSDYKYSANQVKSIIVGDAKNYGITYNINDTEAGRQACYYYKDYPSAKLRYIFVDAVDTNTQNGDSMLISGLSLAQMKWLRNAVDTTPQGYQLAIVSHMPVAFSLWGYNYPQGKFSYNSSTSAWTYSKHAYWTLEKSYVPYINALAQKVQSEALPIGNQNAENFDFTNAPDVAFLISGHMHKDGQCYNGFWEINCANAWTNTDNIKYSPLYYGGNSSENPFKGEIDTSVNVTNGKNTVYEDLVDCVVVSNSKGTKGTQDYVEGLISVFRVGAGANRIFHRDEVVVAIGETHEFTHSFGDNEVVWWVYDSETHQEGNTQYKSEHASMDSGVLTAISSESSIVNAPQAYVESEYNTEHIEYETVLFEDKAYVTVVAYCKEKNVLEFWGIKIV